MHRDPASALAERCVEMCEPHRLGVAEELEQGRHIGKARRTERQPRSFHGHTAI
jgi:hypothetical protein